MSHREFLINRFQADGYEEPIDGQNWRQFPLPEPIPEDPDAWQLFQDGRSVSDRFPDGYSPSVDPLRRSEQPKGLSGF